jgi:hypothetical protein
MRDGGEMAGAKETCEHGRLPAARSAEEADICDTGRQMLSVEASHVSMAGREAQDAGLHVSTAGWKIMQG